VIVAAVSTADAATKITAGGTVHCTVTGTVKFGPALKATPRAKTKVSIKAALTCPGGETGYSGIDLVTGKMSATSSGVTASCTTAEFGTTVGSITWKAAGASVTPTKVAWGSTAVSETSNVVIDLSNAALPPSGKPGSYVGELMNLHISSDLAPGELCSGGSKGFKIFSFTAGSTLDISQPNPHNLPIKHVLLFMQENRSADSYFSQLSSQGQPDYEAEPMTGNPNAANPSGPPIIPFHKTYYCEPADLDHSWTGTHNEVDGGLMDGFTTQSAGIFGQDPTGARAMGYYDNTDLPYYYGLYNAFSTGDRYFSSVLSQTFPNRLYELAGTSFGHIRNDVSGSTQRSIFNVLDEHSITWKIYSYSAPLSYGSLFFKYVAAKKDHVFSIANYFTDLANNDLPEVAFIDPTQSGTPRTENDEHPPANVQVGQKFVADIVNGLMNSTSWSSSALFLTYDEHGGYYDHVVPPAAVPPDNIPPKLLTGDTAGAFDQLGVRMPVVVVSPYSKAHHVSHVVDDHTSLLSFIEYRFGLPPLTNRDAAADPMLDHFDFSTPALATPPSLPAAVIDPVKLAAC
jgi:phospholipase C